MAKESIADHVIRLFNLGIEVSDICDLTGLTVADLHKLVEVNKKVEMAKKKGKFNTNLKVIEALLKSATGYTTKETKIDKKYGKDGKTVIQKAISEIKKEMAPNVVAIRMWLEARDSDNWKEAFDKAETKFNINVKVEGKEIIVEEEE
jgi:hypothetical protein